MKNNMVYVAMMFSLILSSLSADALKNSLTNMLHEQDSLPMVNLGQINLDAKPKPTRKIKKIRSGETVIATINDYKLIKKNADTYLSKRTNGKVNNFDLLSLEQKKRLVQEMAIPILSISAANKELSEDEKLAIYTRVWMQKEASKIKISEDDVKGVYNILKIQAEKRMKEQNIAIENNTTINEFPPFEAIALKIKGQMIEKQLVDNVVKDLNVTLAK